MRSVIPYFSVLSALIILSACSASDGGTGAGSGGSSNAAHGGSGGSVATGGTPANTSGGTFSQGGTANGSGGITGGGSGGFTQSGSGGAAAGNGGSGAGGGATSGGSAGATSGGAGGGGTSANGGSAQGGTNAMGGSGGGVMGGSGGATTGGGGGTGPRPPCTPPTSYRNLFAEFLGKTDADVGAKLAAGWDSLFKGGANETVYYASGGDEAYIKDIASNDVRSEGISYGMTIAVELDKKDEFNRLWKFAKQHMAMSGNNAGMFNWRTNESGAVTGNGSAPDGEEYFATALIFASKRWGDGSGIYAYSNEAKTVLDALANKGLFNRSNNLVLFLQNSGYTDPSYMLPAFYEVWSCFDTKNQSFWKSTIGAARNFFQKTTHPTTGLAPYLASFDGSPNGSQDKGTTFRSDAWRVVGNIMMDHHFFGADPWQTTFAARYAAFFEKVWASAPYPDEFNIDGTTTHENAQPSKGLQAQNAMVGFGLAADKATPFVKALWDMEIPTGQYRYYDGMLYMLAFLHVSGRFHLYY